MPDEGCAGYRHEYLRDRPLGWRGGAPVWRDDGAGMVRRESRETPALCAAVRVEEPRVSPERSTASGSCDGVPQDYVQAHMWFNLAASRMTGEDRELAVENRDRAEDLS